MEEIISELEDRSFEHIPSEEKNEKRIKKNEESLKTHGTSSKEIIIPFGNPRKKEEKEKGTEYSLLCVCVCFCFF